MLFRSFHQFLDVLREIEDGKLDQHEGSFKVGTILKEMYVDSALKKIEKIEKETETKRMDKTIKKINNINWKSFKQMK